MKKIIILILLFISIISFGQNKEYRKATNLYNSKQYAEANVILEKLLQKEYGELDEEMAYWVLYMNAGCYLSFNDNKTAYNKFTELLNVVKNSQKLYSNKSDKEKTINSISTFLDDLKLKLPIEDKILRQETSDVNSNDVTQAKAPDNNSVINKVVSDDKTVTLTVSGTGKTLEEAKLNALRSAIEQAFGAFVSSKTEILNDNLVKDEIVSVASGNVQKYDIVSQIELPGVGFATTLIATVSIDKLTSFAESKGVVVEFKGSMFASNIKLQNLNENSEFKAISNLTKTSFTLLNSAIDFDLKVSEPMLKKYSTSEYEVNFTINSIKNKNYAAFEKYFSETLSKIFMKADEVENYKKINKPIYCIITTGNKINYLRHINSVKLLVNFFTNSQILLNSFKVYSNLGKIKYAYSDVYNTLMNYGKVRYGIPEFEARRGDKLNYPFIFNSLYVEMKFVDVIKQINTNYGGWLNNSYYLQTTPVMKLTNIDELLYDNFSSVYDTTIGFGEHPLFIDLGFRNPSLKFTKTFQLQELEKINEFKIDKLEIEELLKKTDEYILPNAEYDYSCFLSGTIISTPQGTKLIENIKVGDEIICFDDRGNLHTSVVENINSHENQDVYKYSVWNGNAIYATPNHWVLTSENSFAEIGKLNEMLTLVDIDGGLKPITKVEYFGKEKVYNFIVKDYHTYIANGIKVHNGGKGKFRIKNKQNN